MMALLTHFFVYFLSIYIFLVLLRMIIFPKGVQSLCYFSLTYKKEDVATSLFNLKQQSLSLSPKIHQGQL